MNKLISTTSRGISGRQRTSGNSCHKGTSPCDAQSACKESLRAAPERRGAGIFWVGYRAEGSECPVQAIEPLLCLERGRACWWRSTPGAMERWSLRTGGLVQSRSEQMSFRKTRRVRAKGNRFSC